MDRRPGPVSALISLALTLAPAVCLAGGKANSTCCNTPTCFVWKMVEINETVYDVTFKEEKKKVKKPVIKEIQKPVSCRVCKPVPRTVLREVCTPDYQFDTKTVDEVVHKTTVDECGNCCTTTEVVPQLVTCIKKVNVPQMIPVLEWTKVPMEDVHTEKFLVREWVDEEVTVSTPVLTPRTITRKVWSKVPTCAPCETCCP